MATPRSPAGKSSGAGSEKSKQTPAPLAGVCGPITPEDNLVARTFSYVHVAVVLSSYYLNFSNLVANPVKTLAVSLVSLAVMQLLYLMLCLPLSTPSTRQRRSAGGPRPGGAGAPGTGPGAGASDVAYVQKAFVRLLTHDVVTLQAVRVSLTHLAQQAAVYSIILTLALATPVLYLLTILLGGPFLSHTPHTLLLAAHTAMLASPGLFYVHGVDRSAWTRVVALQQPLDEVSGAALGAVVGAWVGAVPIPLDWDREWQAWPVTVVTGAYVGWAVGRAAGGSVWWGRKLAMQ